MSTATLWPMAGEPDTFTKHRPIRVAKPRWDAFGLLVGPRSRAKIVNEFIAWYIREPGAKLPKRPDIVMTTHDGVIVTDVKDRPASSG